MSIIHEALKKIQIKRGNASPAIVASSVRKEMRKEDTRIHRLQAMAKSPGRAAVKRLLFRLERIRARDRLIFLAGTASFLGLLMLYSVLPQHAFRSHPSLTLNGVFVSDDMKLAMVNNQPYHIGDKIAAMKLVSIDHDGIKLQNGDELLDLRVKPFVA